MRRGLLADLGAALAAAENGLAAAARVIRLAYGVDRVSVSALESRGRRFQIQADAGAALLSPGTALPVETCSYFSETLEGRPFLEPDLAAAPGFSRPVDGVILAAGFRSGASVPIRRRDQPVGALSLSATAPLALPGGALGELVALGELLGDRIEARPAIVPRVLVCEADPLTRAGLARVAEREAGAEVRLAATAAEAVAVATGQPPDVVVAGDGFGASRAESVVSALRAAGVELPIVLVATRITSEAARAAAALGATALIGRDRALSQLAPALAAARSGLTLPAPLPAPAEPRLTPREAELIRQLDEGLRFKQVARRLGISEATAKTHARHLFRKLDATSRAEAVHTARERGLLP